MNRIDAFIHYYSSKLRWLKHRRSAKTGERALSSQGQQGGPSLNSAPAVSPLGDGKPQPVARLLDSSEDIADQYSRHTTQSERPLADLRDGDAPQKTCAYGTSRTGREPGQAEHGDQARGTTADHIGVWPNAKGREEPQQLPGNSPNGCTLESIEQEYQRKFGRFHFEKFARSFLPVSGAGNLQKGQISSSERAHPAPEVEFCEVVIDQYHGFERTCGRRAVGTCLRCGLDLCMDCAKYDGSCSETGSPWHVLEAKA